MDSKELENRIDKANAKFVTGEDAGGETPAISVTLGALGLSRKSDVLMAVRQLSKQSRNQS